MPKFDWNSLPVADDSQAPKPSGKFDWNSLPEANADEDTNGTIPKKDPGLLEKVGEGLLHGVIKVGETIDRFGGAPTRAAIGAAQDGQNPITAFGHQFGENPHQAPTGRDIVHKAGVPDTSLSAVLPDIYNDTGEGWQLKRGGWADPTASGTLGVALDVAADPLNFVPLGEVAKGVSGIAAKSAGAVGKAATEVGELAGRAGTKITTKVGSLMTGVPEKEIETYIQQYPEVQKMISEYGDDVAGAADKIREGYQNSIRSKRMALGQQVGQALDSLPKDKLVDIEPVVSELHKVQGRMNKTLRLEEVKQIDDLVDRIKSLGGDAGKVTPKEMFEIKQFLQDRGSGAFMKDGQIFVPGKDAQIAAKNASRTARDLVNTMSPTVADANKELSRLHVLESRINKNLIAPGKSEAALSTAGSASNPKNASQLQVLGQMTDTDMLGEAEKFAAMRRFANPGYTAADSTGKGMERAIKAGLVGQAVGGPISAGIAVMATSPAALKFGIQAGRIPVSVIKKLAGASGALTDATINQAYRVLKTPTGKRVFEAAMQAAKSESIEGRAGADVLKNVASDDSNAPVANNDQIRGETRWALNGIDKLGIKDQALADRLLQSKEGKRLLIEASDLPAGSKRLQTILNQISKGGVNQYGYEPSSGNSPAVLRRERKPASRR